MAGEHEVKLTRVYAVHQEMITDEHNPRPNWNYGAPSAPGFNLVIEAEAGRAATPPPSFNYHINVYCIDLTGATPATALRFVPAGQIPPAGAVTAASGWVENIETQQWTRQWVMRIGQAPNPPLLPAHVDAGGDQGRVVQYYVTMVDIGAAGPHVASFAASEPILIV